jgi:hypothetical protein
MNFGMGSNARRRKRWFEAFIRKAKSMLASEIRRGWADQPPVIAEILVLSDERIVPRSITPIGNFDCDQ